MPADGGLEAWPGKPFQYAAAERAGIPTPSTFFPRSREELAALSARMQYPCLVKPAFSHKWLSAYKNRKLSFVQTPEELVEVGQDAMDKGLEILVQEYVPGGDDNIYTFQAYANAEGRVLAGSVRRKLRQYPPHFGSGSMAVSVREPRVEELGGRLMESLRFHGIGSVEFKRDSRDGQFKLMELNGDGARELVELFERIKLSGEAFEFRAFTRVKQLKYLVESGQIDAGFFWRRAGV